MATEQWDLDQDLQDVRDVVVWFRPWVRGTIDVVRWIGEQFVSFNGVIKLVVLAIVVRVVATALPLLTRSDAIKRRQADTFVNTVADARAKAQAASAEGAKAIIRQCVLLVLICGALSAALASM